jgi:hypothetical protein
MNPINLTTTHATSLQTPALAKPGAGSAIAFRPSGEFSGTSFLPGDVVETELHGVAYCDRKTVIPVIWEGEEVWLVRKPDNAHDANSIAAYRRIGRRLGYVPWDLADALAPIFDGYGLPVPATITALTNGSRPLSIHVRFRVPQPNLSEDQTPPAILASSGKRHASPQEAAVCTVCEKSDSPERAFDLSHPESAPCPADKADHAEPPGSAIPVETVLAPEPEPPEEEYLALPGRNGHIQETMALAATELRWLWIEYCDAWNHVTQRTILPLAPYVALDGAPGFQSWCGLRRDFRTFLCDRVLAIVPGERLTQEDRVYGYLSQVLPEVRNCVK